MSVYDLYGTTSDNPLEAKEGLEKALDVSFAMRSSDYMAGTYFKAGESSSEHFVLKLNTDPFDNKPSEPLFPAYNILLYVNDTAQQNNIRERVNVSAVAFTLLRHEEFT